MTLVSFDGWDVAAAGFDSYPAQGNRDLAIAGSYLGGGRATPRFAGIQRANKAYPYVLRSTAADLEQAWQDLYFGLRLDLEQERRLVIQRPDGMLLQNMARVSDVGVKSPGIWNVTFQLSDAIWRAVTPVMATVVGPATSGGTITRDVTLTGTVRTRPKVTLFPQKPKTSGVIYSQPVTMTEASGNDLTSVPYTYTVDHAALVTAGKSTAAGTDILVTVDGVPVDRSVTGANTSSCRITFPLSVGANSSAAVTLTYAPSGQTYSGATYAQDSVVFTVTEQHGVTLTDFPYRLDFDHAAKVTAGRSKSSGADIRVFVDGIEQDRALSGINTSTCKVWVKLDLPANGTDVVAITTAASGYDYAGATYTPANGALDLATSSNGTAIYTTPVISNNDDSPLALKPVLTRLNATADPTNYQVANGVVTGTDPGITASIMDIASPTQNGNYIRFYAGGLRLVSLTAAYRWRTGATVSTMHSVAYIGQSANLSTWSALRTFAQTISSGAAGPDTTTFSPGNIAGIVGIERVSGDPSQTIGTANTNYMQVTGSGSSELTLTLNAADIPTNGALTAAMATAGIETFGYVFNGNLSDELGHTVALRNLSAPSLWTPTTNLLHNTEAMGNSVYTKVNTTVMADNTTAPDGTESADTLFETTTNGQHRLTRQISKAASSLSYVYSVYAKAHGRDYLDFNVMDASRANGVNVGFNVTTGALNFSPIAFGSGFTAGSAAITLAANGFYRCSVAITSNTATTLLGEVLIRSAAGTNSYAGDITKGVDLWGMQLEQSTTLSAYQPVYPVGGVVIDADQRTAYLVDLAGAVIPNTALAARSSLGISGNDTDWLACEPNGTTTFTWSEPGMDADGMRVDVEVASRWH